MEQVISLGNTRVETEGRQFSVVDTTFVLFFLAVDIGSSLFSMGYAGILAIMTLLMFAVIPYFLPSETSRPDLKSWLLGRLLIASFALIIGILFAGAVGTILPATFKFMPLTLLIIAAMASCYVQLYGIIKYRLAR